MKAYLEIVLVKLVDNLVSILVYVDFIFLMACNQLFDLVIVTFYLSLLHSQQKSHWHNVEPCSSYCS